MTAPSVALVLPASSAAPAWAGAAGLRVVPLGSAETDVVIVVGGVRVLSLLDVGETPILLLVPADRPREVGRALAAGATGALADDAGPGPLRAAVEALRAGLSVLPASRRGHEVLTARQQQLLGLLVLGLTNDEIAARLHLSVTTVKSHLNAAYRKLDVRSRKEAAALILDPESGYGPGILGVSSVVVAEGYGRPSIRS